MNRRISTLALAFAALAATAENPHFSPHPVSNDPTPNWKRKKCKSCSGLGGCRTNPNNQACKEYQKKKK